MRRFLPGFALGLIIALASTNAWAADSAPSAPKPAKHEAEAETAPAPVKDADHTSKKDEEIPKPDTAEPGPEKADPGEQPPSPAPEPQTPRTRMISLLMHSPLQMGHNSFLHALLGIPGMRAGEALPTGAGRVYFASELTNSTGDFENGDEMKTLHYEGSLGLQFGVSEFLEFHAGLHGAAMTGDAAFTWNGIDLVDPDRGERLQISRLNIGAMFNLLPLGQNAPEIWAAIDVKVSASDEDLVDSGRPTLAFRFLMTQKLGPIWAHLNIGWFLADGQEALAPMPTAMGDMYLKVNRSFFWGLSLAWPFSEMASLNLQYDGNTNAFRDLTCLDSDVHTLSLGLRYVWRTYYVELGGGFGLSSASADFEIRLELGVLVDPEFIAKTLAGR